MKVSKLISLLKKCDPDKDVVFWDGSDNWDISECENDSVNNTEVVLKY